jgi:sulfatase modifying factor 1
MSCHGLLAAITTLHAVGTSSAATKGMVELPGGTFAMGSAEFYPEEGPVRPVTVGPFAIDRHPVTVAAFRQFVGETGYVTVSQRPLDASLYPDADPELLVPGSLVFTRTSGPVDLRDVRQWWRYVPGAWWSAPEGPGSDVRGRHRHPVTQVAFEDAQAYATWAGKELPTEAEWEYAARGGLDGARFAWGDEITVSGRLMANTWQGQFPWQNLRAGGYEGTSPVGSFPPNAFGLFDVCGNVWEWTTDRFDLPDRHRACCGPQSERPAAAPELIEGRVIKGGSHLCSPSYCLRFRPAARQREEVDTSTTHIGFRCVVRGG